LNSSAKNRSNTNNWQFIAPAFSFKDSCCQLGSLGNITPSHDALWHLLNHLVFFTVKNQS